MTIRDFVKYGGSATGSYVSLSVEFHRREAALEPGGQGVQLRPDG